MASTTLETRDELTPQMKEYDRAGRVWVPYLNYFHRPNHRSPVVNTDSRGFRFVVGKDGRTFSEFEREPGERVRALVGGSTVFGVGATGDAATLPSLLSQRGPARWLNFGGRAFSSTQELMLFLFHARSLGALEKVTLLSGVNNLLLFYLSRDYAKDYGSFFSATEVRRAFAGDAPSPAKSGVIGRLKSIAGGRRAKVEAPEPEIVLPIVDHDAQKTDLLHAIERDLSTWKLLSGALQFELCYVLQPLAGWVRKKPSPEETRLFADLDDQQGEAWRQILREKMDLAQYAWFSKSLADICRTQEIPFLDMNATLSALDLDGRWIFVDRVHLTDEGNEVLTQALVEGGAT
ncbi:hypothetical protein [Chondromyces crocatus]|uniref:SGNH hydrolase-type esterase domain-containing protein n=1 Tax=Chondromyces crocatus TaxID=52 RepID=A0A0K1EC25_CHOCO|nr:hypothetical protein [Chondromyces crocatus]AKT38409.1 uncharacterized protein CMC5_025550 [Chondromyces crocatus]